MSLGQSVGDTSVQLEEVQGLVQQLTQCWQQLQVQVVDKQVSLEGTAFVFLFTDLCVLFFAVMML